MVVNEINVQCVSLLASSNPATCFGVIGDGDVGEVTVVMGTDMVLLLVVDAFGEDGVDGFDGDGDVEVDGLGGDMVYGIWVYLIWLLC